MLGNLSSAKKLAIFRQNQMFDGNFKFKDENGDDLFYDKVGFTYNDLVYKLIYSPFREAIHKDMTKIFGSAMIFFHALMKTRTKSVIFNLARRNSDDAERMYKAFYHHRIR